MIKSRRMRLAGNVARMGEKKNAFGQGEAPHRKYKRLKLGGGHVYDCSSV
jgi:hypothetical protein